MDDEARCPVLAAFDIKTAFPAISHRWLYTVLDVIDALHGFQNMVRSQYSGAAALGRRSCGAMFLLFYILSGVVQGCTMSGLLFALSFDPFVRELARRIDDVGLGTSRMCADDVGIAFRHVHGLIAAHEIFDNAKLYASLFLNFSKCFLVPLSLCLPASLEVDPRGSRIISNRADREDVHRWLLEWLLRHIPQWSSFQISNATEYLGVWLGPVSAQLRWKAAIDKWFLRGISIAAACAPPLTSVCLYEQRCLSGLGYLAQFFWLPDIKLQERRLLSKIMKYPFTMLTIQNDVNLGDWGGFSWRSVWITSLATLIRAAMCTFSTWNPCFRWLSVASSLDSTRMPLREARLCTFQLTGWDTAAIAATLMQASNGFPKNSYLIAFVPSLIRDTICEQKEFEHAYPNRRF